MLEDRWNAIYNNLSVGRSTWEIRGEVVGGKPLERNEVAYVLKKLREGGTYL